MAKTTNKGFIIDLLGNRLLPITRGELVLDASGNVALRSSAFLAGNGLPGLVTAAERALLSGSTGGGLSDLSDKLDYINNGLMVNSSVLLFYNSEGSPTPINIIKGTSNTIELATNNNVVTLDLVNIGTATSVVNGIIRNISIDDYGRVISISSGSLLDSDLPNTIASKTISNSVLSNSTTADVEIGSDNKAIANKAYVDSKFALVSGIATGALKFGGAVSSLSFAENILEDEDSAYKYYKVTVAFNLSKDYLYDTSGLNPGSDYCPCKVGDTLIVYPSSEGNKFLYVPSGDETITYLTVTGESKGTGDIVTPALTKQDGHVTLKFSSIFSVVNNPAGSNTAYISLPQVTKAQSGYLSASDYETFKNYETTLSVSYTPTIGFVPNYNIGQLTIGGTTYAIQGKNDKYTFELNNGYTEGTTLTKDPVLLIKENDSDLFNLRFKGTKGVTTNKSGNNIEIFADIDVSDDSSDFISVTNGHIINVNLGSVSNGIVTEGLTPYSEFSTFKALVLLGTIAFEPIERSLTNKTDSAPEGLLYYYGSDDLQTAIDVVI